MPRGLARTAPGCALVRGAPPPPSRQERPALGCSEREPWLTAHTGWAAPEVNVAAVRTILRAAAHALEDVDPLPREVALQIRRTHHDLLVQVHVADVRRPLRGTLGSCGARPRC